MKLTSFLAVFALPFCLLAEDAPQKYTLKQCITYAQEHSPVLAKQKIAVHNQKLQSIIEEAQFAWTLSGSTSQEAQAGENSSQLTLSKDFMSGFAVKTWVNSVRENGQGVTSNYVAVQLSKTILGSGSAAATRYGLETSLLEELISLNTFNRASRKLAQDVKIAYYTVIAAQQSLLVKQRALENAKHTLALTREREKPLDILTAEIRIPENELSVNTAQRTIQNGLDSLKELMGMPVEEPFEITGDFDFSVQENDLKADLDFGKQNLETFLNNRLERKKLELQQVIYDQQTLPDVKLAATHYQYGDGDNFNFNGRDEQLLSLSFSWELGRRSDCARLEIVNNKLVSNQHDFFILAQDLTNSLTSYYRRLLESASAVKLQENICDFQKRKEELYRDKWENGEIDILELVRTQTDLENSYVDLISKKISYLELLAYYEYTLGR